MPYKDPKGPKAQARYQKRKAEGKFREYSRKYYAKKYGYRYINGNIFGRNIPLSVNISKVLKKLECQLCSSRNRLLVHHKDNINKNNRLTNLILICRACHNRVHVRNPWGMKGKNNGFNSIDKVGE